MSTPTPTLATASNRVRHAPTHRDPGLPPTMSVAVQVGYVQSCPDCRRIVAELATGCIADATVSALRLVPGRKHAHDVTEGATALPGLTDAASTPVSDTNGSAPEDVEALLFAERANGFDPEVR